MEDIALTRTGGHLIVSISGVEVFVPGGGVELMLLVGDNVTLRGVVSTYAGKRDYRK